MSQEKIDVCISNLNKCSDGIESMINNAEIVLAEFLSTKSPIVQMENNFLQVAASGSSDCTFYCTVISSGTNYIARFFECGNLTGYFHSVLLKKLKEILNTDVILPHRFYCSEDVNIEASRKELLFQKKKPAGKFMGLNCF